MPLTDHDCEEGFLGACFLWPETVGKFIGTDPEIFHEARTREIWQILCEFVRIGKPIDVVLVYAEAERRGFTAAISRMSLQQFAERAPSSATFCVDYVNHLSELLKKRKLRAALINASEQLETESAANVAKIAMTDCVKAAATVANGAISGRDICRIGFEQIEEIRRNGGLLGPSWTIPQFDEMTLGQIPGELTAIGADRSGGGKSSLAMQIGASVASGHTTLIFSAEMAPLTVFAREIARRSGMGIRNVFSSEYLGSDTQTARVIEAADALADSKVFVDATPMPKRSHMFAECIRVDKAYGPLKLVVIDMIQHVRGDDVDDGEMERIAVAIQTAKEIASTFNCHVIAVSNNRKPKDPNALPDMADFYGSQWIDSLAMFAGFLVRVAKFERIIIGNGKVPADLDAENWWRKKGYSRPHKTAAVFLVRKNRYGPLDAVPLIFEGQIFKFTACERIGR